MVLPESVTYCMGALEQAGFSAYVVGGCVRDALLGLTPHDYDLCTNAPPARIRQIFQAHTLICSGEKHGTIGVWVDGQVLEITTFRTEGAYSDGRHPDWVQFVPHIHDDLARRDFTVNAMAYHPRQGLVDPWGGRQDLAHGILRAVGDPQQRFREDALRILRGVRFAVRFGLRIDPPTRAAMDALAPGMDLLARERVFDELCKLLPHVKAADLLEFAPVLFQVLPVLRPMAGFQQHSPHHRYDVFTHTAYVVENTPPDPVLRWAALLHDTGKPACFTTDETGRGHFNGHAAVSAQLADQTLQTLKAPTALREQVKLLILHHMDLFKPDKKLLRRAMGKLGKESFFRLLALQQADSRSKGFPMEEDPFPGLYAAAQAVLQEDACLTVKDLAVDGNDLLALGYPPGPALGKRLQWLLEQVQDEVLPNTRQALLDACKNNPQ